uniref:Uncharacterized protein n=1 Tax=Equus caballus TaxID=9796 RepID=A0A9L0SRM7_HORSE
MQLRAESLFNKWCWENWTATCKRMNVDCYLTPYEKINSRWMKDLKVRPETINLLEENIGTTLFNTCLSSIIWNTKSPQARKTKEKISKWDYINYKASARKGNHQQNTMSAYQLGKNTCKSYMKGLIYTILYKEIIQVNNEK